MSQPLIKILLVADDEDDYALIRDILSTGTEAHYVIEWASTYDKALRVLSADSQAFDLYLIDFFLGSPTRSGLGLLETLREHDPFSPVIFLAGRGDHQVEAVRSGATDYIVKDSNLPSILERSIRYSLEHAKTLRALERSKSQYHALFEQSNDAVFWTDPAGNFLRCNRCAADMFGYSLQELAHLTYRDLVAPDFLSEAENVFTKLTEGQRFPVYERTLRKKSGELFPAEINIESVNDELGHTLYIQSIIRDITIRKQSENVLRRSEERFRQLIEVAPGAVLLIRETGEIVFVNACVEVLFGYQREELIGMSIEMLLPERFRGMHLGHRIKFFARPGTRSMGVGRELAGRRKDGTEFPVEIGLGYITTDEGTLALGFVADITERIEIENERKRSEERFRLLVENSPAGIYMADNTFHFSYVNPRLAEMIGYSLDEVRESDFTKFIAPDDIDRLVDSYVRRRHGENVSNHFEFRAIRKDGEERWFDLRVASVTLSDGQIRTWGQILDVTERKRAEEAAAQRSAALQALHEIALDIGSELNMEVLLRRIVERAMNLLHADRGGAVYLYDADDNILRLVSGAGIHKVREGVIIQPSEGVSGEVFRTSQPLVINDYVHWDKHVEIQMFEPPSAVLGVPLFAQKQIIGVLGIVADSSVKTFDERDVSLAEMFASKASVAIQNARLFEQAQQEIAERKLTERALRESRERLRLVTDNMRDMVMQSDEKGIIQYVSPSAEDIWGIAPHEIVGTYLAKWLGMIHPDDRHSVAKTLANRLATGRGASQETYRFQHPRGQIKWLEHIVSSFTREDGSLAGYIYVIRDIDERIKASENLLKANERFSKVFHTSPIGICISTSREGRYVDVNEAFVKMCGFTSREEIIGRTSAELNTWDDMMQRQVMIQHLLERRSAGVFEYKFRQRSGEVRDALTASEIIELDGEECIICILYDITMTKEAEAQKLELRLMKERTELLRELLNKLSHDLKTPLSVINTSIYLIEKVSDPEKQQQKLENIKTQALHLEKIIQDILTVSKLDSVPEPVFTALDVNDLVSNLVKRFQPLAEEKHLTTRLELSAGLPPILADETELKRALGNLVENSIRYTPDGGVVTVQTWLQDDQIVVAVQDTGIGISTQDLPRIFEHFYRADKARTIDQGGTGLGLAIVKKIIEIHGGRVEVESTLGQGSTFRVELPLFQKNHK